MYTISYRLAQARLADLHDQAKRDTLARAARRLDRRPAGLCPRVLRRTRAVPGTTQAVQPAVAGDADHAVSGADGSHKREAAAV
jgi:hypothetical protein